VGFKPDLGDQPVFDTVGLVIWPVKIVPEMTYYVFSVMLSLYTSTVSNVCCYRFFLLQIDYSWMTS